MEKRATDICTLPGPVKNGFSCRNGFAGDGKTLVGGAFLKESRTIVDAGGERS